MIALFTDFGLAGPYIGQVQAVLAEQCPQAPVVCLFPDLPAFNIRAAAYLLPAYAKQLPVGTVCLCVVDPGVGSEREGLVVKADGRWYVGPDNGVFSQVIKRASVLEVNQIDWRPDDLSASFHGRDWFAPVAAGIKAEKPVPLKRLSNIDLCQPDWPDDLAEILYIDHYGNAITGIRANQLNREAVLTCLNHPLSFQRTFSDAQIGACFWYENANGLVEIAANQARACDVLGLGIGSLLHIG